jgi:hypothetical protein
MNYERSGGFCIHCGAHRLRFLATDCACEWVDGLEAVEREEQKLVQRPDDDERAEMKAKARA